MKGCDEKQLPSIPALGCWQDTDVDSEVEIWEEGFLLDKLFRILQWKFRETKQREGNWNE